MEESVPDRESKRAESRRSDRFPVVAPLQAKWKEPCGKSVVESAEAIEVNTRGGLLAMRTHPAAGTQIELTNLLSRETAQARVIGVRHPKYGKAPSLAVELLTPSESFWGVNFQLKKTSSELVKLEETIRSGGIESRILKEFRDAVDYVRKTAWAVQEWQERQLQHHDPQTVLPLLTAERIRRTSQLCKAISADLATYQGAIDSFGLEEFTQTLQATYRQLLEILGKGEASG